MELQTTETLTRDEGSDKYGAITFVVRPDAELFGKWLGVVFSRAFVDASYVVLVALETAGCPIAPRVVERYNYGFKVMFVKSGPDLTLTAQPYTVTLHWHAAAAIPSGSGVVQCGRC